MVNELVESYLNEFKRILSDLDKDKISQLVDKIKETNEKGRTIFLIGNGGSASTASHWACDLVKGTIKDFEDKNEKRLKVICLTDNIPIMTAYANDLSYDEIFSQPLKNLVKKGDLLIAITCSGKSKNIMRGIEVAKEAGNYVFSLVGFDGGNVAPISDNFLIVPSKNYGIIEDFHLVLNHLVTASLKGKNNYINDI